MIGKRRRDDSPTALDPPATLRLTRTNLAAHQANMDGATRVRKDKLSAKVSVSSGTGTSVSKASKSSIADVSLKKRRYYAGRNLPRSQSLNDLISQITTPRSCATTPTSRAIARMQSQVKVAKEADAMLAFHDLLGYRGEIQPNGEEGIYRGLDHQWRLEAMPKRDKEDENADASASKGLGLPSRPKPDIAYGYTTSSFTPHQIDTILDLPNDHRVEDEQPWFPYCIYEWKSSRTASEWKALCQARRDGPTAVNAARNLFITANYEDIPDDWTTVFSVCVTSSIAQIYVHWRRLAGDGDVTWECDEIESAFLHKPNEVFRIRTALLNILEWARGPRLARFMEALARCSLVIASEAVLVYTGSIDGNVQ